MSSQPHILEFERLADARQLTAGRVLHYVADRIGLRAGQAIVERRSVLETELAAAEQRLADAEGLTVQDVQRLVNLDQQAATSAQDAERTAARRHLREASSLYQEILQWRANTLAGDRPFAADLDQFSQSVLDAIHQWTDELQLRVNQPVRVRPTEAAFQRDLIEKARAEIDRLEHELADLDSGRIEAMLAALPPAK